MSKYSVARAGVAALAALHLIFLASPSSFAGTTQISLSNGFGATASETLCSTYNFTGDPDQHGWHFVLPGSESSFSAVSIDFVIENGNPYTATDFISVQGGKGAYLLTPIEWQATLVGGKAWINGSATRFVLSHTCTTDPLVPDPTETTPTPTETTPTPTETTPTPTETTPTPTETTPTPTETTPTPTETTPTPTETTPTPTQTTPTPTQTTPTQTPTPTPTPTQTTPTPTPTPTQTTQTPTQTPTPTPTPTQTPVVIPPSAPPISLTKLDTTKVASQNVTVAPCGQPVTIKLVGPNGVTFKIERVPTHGTLTQIDSVTMLWTPDPKYCKIGGNDGLIYSWTDKNGNTGRVTKLIVFVKKGDVPKLISSGIAKKKVTK